MSTFQSTLLLAIGTLLYSTNLLGEDWVRFRGPDGAGVSEQSAPETWSATENLRWKLELPGPGSSSPIIVGERVFVTCYVGKPGSGGATDQMTRQLICINRKTGMQEWKSEVPAIGPEDPAQGFIMDHGYASSTPTSDGERVYVFFGKSGVLAYDLTGKKLWQTSVGTSSSNRRWGSGASPILFENMVIVNASEESRTIWALDKMTGEVKWKSPADSLELSYSTPVITKNADGKHEMLVSVAEEVWALNPNSGKVIWYASTGVAGNASPSPVVFENNVFITGGRPGASAALKMGGKGDITKTNLLWKSPNYSYVPSPIYFQDHLYWVNDTGIAVCLNAKTGAEVYKERVMTTGASSGGRGGGKTFYASMTRFGDKLYAVSRTNGTYVLPAKPEFKVLSHNTLGTDTSDCNASPVITDGEIYLRSNQAIYCISSKK